MHIYKEGCGEMLLIIGAVIIVLTIVAIIKKVENRLALTVSGLAMASVAGIAAWASGAGFTAFCDMLQKFLDGFTSSLVSPTLVPITCASMGYAFLMDKSGCTEGLISVLVKPLKKLSAFMIPATIIIVFLLNIAIPSASGVGATSAPLLIPVMMAAGIHPVIAAGAVLLGTWGSTLYPGNPFLAQVSDISGTSTTQIVAGNVVPELITLIIMCISFTAIAMFLKEQKGYESNITIEDAKSVNPVKSIMPVIPLLLLVLAALVPGFPQINVLGSMLLGGGITLVVVWILDKKDPGDMTKEFFKGMGDSYGSIICLMAAASAFTAGMTVLGLTQALIDSMQGTGSTIARLSGGIGPFLIAMLTGSGNAATVAFNQAITPFAADFGMSIDGLGSIATICAQFGRSASPVAGITFIVAGVSKADPMEIIKRTMIPSIISTIVIMLIL